jgi:predicted  nucleic acid-binding Zn-ribbon protein
MHGEYNDLEEEIDDLREENWEQYREISFLKDDIRSRDTKVLALEEEVDRLKEIKGVKTSQQKYGGYQHNT